MTDGSFEDFMRSMDEFSAQLDQAKADFERTKAKLDAQLGEERENLAQRRRNGECGADWQVLQQRIDMRQTTERDIISGVDKSKEARAVRAQMTKAFGRLERQIEADDGDAARAFRAARDGDALHVRGIAD